MTDSKTAKKTSPAEGAPAATPESAVDARLAELERQINIVRLMTEKLWWELRKEPVPTDDEMELARRTDAGLTELGADPR